MLNSSLHWFGKIPTQAEFISSNTAPTLQAKFDAWIASGQNHIGNQLVGSSVENSLYAYVFCVRNLEQNHLTTGILLTSRDSKHRRYPFIIFGEHNAFTVETFIQQVQQCFEQLNINLATDYSGVDESLFFNNLSQALTRLYSYPNKLMDEWIEFYPMPMQLKLSIDALTPIVYRKLMLRGY
jgi:type VI secretion system ImpM family protein